MTGIFYTLMTAVAILRLSSSEAEADSGCLANLLSRLQEFQDVDSSLVYTSALSDGRPEESQFSVGKGDFRTENRHPLPTYPNLWVRVVLRTQGGLLMPQEKL